MKSRTGTAPRSSRFRVEALRLGVTPMSTRTRQQPQEQVSPSQAAISQTQESKSHVEAGENFEGAQEGVGVGSHGEHVPAPLAALDGKDAQSPTVSVPDPPPESPAMSSNPLAGENHGSTPVGVVSIAATPSGATSGTVSNNPLFSGTPTNPTPGSVNMRVRLTGMGAAVRTPSSGSSAASEGMRLAEKLHEAAEKLQTPLHAAATPSATPASAGSMAAAAPSQEDHTFEFKDDVAALLQALDARTPLSDKTPAGPATGAAGRALAAASTEERPKAQARRRSSLSNGSPTILDLNGFDADGERRLPGMSTPLTFAAPAAAQPSPGDLSVPKATSASAAEVEDLLQRIAELEEERTEAASLLAGYQGSIAELQDRHSAATVRAQAEMAMLKSEVDRLRAERAEIHSQFESLYNDKYNPLKAEAAALRRGADVLRAKIAQGEATSARVTQLEQEVAAAQQAALAAQQSAEAAKAEAAAAREAERLAEQRAAAAGASIREAEGRWAAKYEAEAKRAQQALSAKEAEVSSWREKHAALARQHDDLLHRVHVAQAAKERKGAEVARKEEEICALEVRLQEVMNVLEGYKAENSKFVGVKEHYKATIVELQKQNATLAEEKTRLVVMLNETMNRLEAAGMSL